MKSHTIFERCQLAKRLEAILLIASVVGTVTAVFVLLRHGLLLGLPVFLLSLLIFALASLFDLVADTLSSVGRVEENIKAGQTQNTKEAAHPESSPRNRA
jgi:hypothetical protein